ncbi:PREDICTED: 50S ribosomal protein L19, chloroplastic isoform X1 [Camelina sativa]|uniref:50S ribosomal protein L19, chloroplastic isoform X1 n=1 Tax=Camelina sativa TaxID=90675 RepID=A0ABM1RGC2_CAMSA|nr:PREDICTED: 50S ribosomal protein L19, chloroplastic isoform X1 [Camelina sativa]
MQSIRSTTRLLLQRHRVSISNTLRFTASSSSSSSCGSWSENESRRLGFDSFSSTRAFDSAATYRISSLKNAAFSSSVVPKQNLMYSSRWFSTVGDSVQTTSQKQNLMYSSRCFSTVGDSVKTTSQVSPEELASDVPQRIKFKRLDKTAKHIMQIIDKEAVEEVRTQREIPRIEPGYLVQLKVEVPENKRRVSVVKGIVIAKRNAGLNSTFRIRRLVAGVGVESMFPLYSPNLREIKVLEKKKVRRAKLYYLREKTNALKKH